MRKEKLPILRWSLDAFALLCLLLMVYFLDSCSKQLPSAETGLCSYPLGIIISGVLFFLFVVIAVRDLIQHPKQHKILLSLFAMIAIYTLFYNLRWGGDSIIKIMILMLFFPSVFIFFLWNRNKTENHIHLLKNEQIYCTPKHDIYFYMALPTIACIYCALRYGIYGNGWDPLLLIFVFPVYIFFLSVWIYRGWKNKMRQSTLKDIITISNNKYTKSKKKK